MIQLWSPDQLNVLLEKVFKEGLEGLVVKGLNSYVPFLCFTGGMMSVFLMGCYNPAAKRWCTVTKVSGGHDDETLKRLQTELKMTKISKDSSKIPDWLMIHKGTVTPDFITKDPKDSQVWEITGAEFSKSDIHTADGISIRFPRVTKIRDDKDWKTATDLPRLKLLFEKSKETSTFKLVGKSAAASTDSPGKSSPSKSAGKRLSSNGSSSSTDSPAKKKKLDNGAAVGVSPVTSKNPITNVFLKKTFYLSSDHADYAKLKRYVIAYGGELEADEDEADYVVQKDEGDGGSSNAVTAEWVYSCITANEILQ
ncbi:LIG3 [Bugula neritina]|uniref:LIG3 n=1 Tax=Bugula neritina TaxID=10212 RepID=A0A7J7J7K7_BUGNE|nr:LIG3 [Bugula neritina]